MKFVIKKTAFRGHRYDPRVDGVTQSMIATRLECPEKARLSIVEMLSSTRASRPFIFGDISHQVLDYHYTKLKDTVVWTPRDSINHAKKWVDDALASWYSRNKHIGSDAPEIVEESGAIIYHMFPHYVQQWMRQDFSYKWTMVETKFDVPIEVDGEIVRFMGKIDGSYDDKGEDTLFETKNKAQFSDKMGLVLPLDLQLGSYLTAKTKLGSKPRNVNYNLIRRPGERRGKTESIADYAARIGANVAKDPAHYFERYKIKLTDLEMNRHILGTELRVAEFFRWWKKSEQTPGVPDLGWNGNSCDGKYGVCGMINICANGDMVGVAKRKSVHPEL